MQQHALPRPSASGSAFLLALIALIGGLLAVSCTTQEEADHYLTWNLSASLAEYDRVQIDLVSALDTNDVLEAVWNEKLPDPVHFKKHKLTKAKGKTFTIRIRCFNEMGDLVYSRDIKVDGTKPEQPQVLLTDVRLHGLTTEPAGLAPDFKPNVYSYTLQLPSDKAAFDLVALPMDATTRLAVNGKDVKWNDKATFELNAGANPFSLLVSDGKGREGTPYKLIVNRGEVVDPSKVTSVTVLPKDLVLYTNGTTEKLAAAVDPSGALVEWSSQNEDVAKVDPTGVVSPEREGQTTVTAKAGKFSDRAAVAVKKAPPALDVGNGIGVKVGTEVDFKIALTLTKATVVSFKYYFEGGDNADNSDTATVPETVKHTYASLGKFDARFEVRDSRGNFVSVTRTITVGDADHSLTILSPSNNTTVNTSPITVRYRLDDTELTVRKDLVEGENPVKVDTLGVSATVTVWLDTKPPKAPEVTGPAPSADPMPTWTWKTGGEGSGSYRFSLDSTTLKDAPASAALSYKPTTALTAGTHILYVQEQDAAGNWSPVGKASATILSPDKTPPEAPNVNGTTPTNEAPKWSWSTGGGDGTGDFRWKLDDTTLSSGATETKEKSYTHTAAVSGKTYTLYVQERDAAGNWSKSGSKAIEFDQSKPAVSIVAPQASGTFITREDKVTLSGKATGSGPRTITRVSYKLGEGTPINATFAAGNWSVADLPLAEGTVTFSVTAYDDLGNPSAAQTLVLKRDATIPNPPAILTAPSTPTKATKGTWTWSAGSDNVGGSDLNGQYRYSLNNGASWTVITGTILSDVNLPEGTVTFLLQEQDFAGNWSTSAPSTIKVDRTPPRVAIGSPAKNATLNSATAAASGTASDDGTSVASVMLTGQNAGNGIATLGAGTWTSNGDLTFRVGKDTLIATATDAVGNSASDTAIVTIDIPVPTVQITYPVANFATNKDTISVRYKVNGSNTEQTTSPYSLTTEGPIELTVTVPNGPGTPGTAKVTVIRDVTPPNAPTLDTAGSFSKTNAAWTWKSNGDNTGGSGVAATMSYQYQVNGGAWTSIGVTTHSIANPPEGTYSLVVQQVDKAGNWSASSTAKVVTVDRTAPTVAVSSPADQYITSATSVSLVCKIDGTDLAGVSTALTEGTNTLTCSKTDAAGNTGTKSITVYNRRNVLFVKVGGTGNASTSNSWATAFGSIQAAINAAASSASLQKQIWVAGGTYAQTTGVLLKTGISIYGGFSPTAFGTSLGSRTFGAADTVKFTSSLANGADYIFYMTGSNTAPIDNDTLDGIQFIVTKDQGALKYDYARKAYINGVQVIMTTGTYQGIYARGSDLSMNNLYLTGLQGFGQVLITEAGSFAGFEGSTRLTNSTLENNGTASSGSFIRSTVLTTTITMDNKLKDRPSSGNYQIAGGNGSGTLTVTSNKIRGVLAELVGSGLFKTLITTPENTFVNNF